MLIPLFPPEIQCAIFDNFSLLDLVELRLTDQSFKNAIDNYLINELQIKQLASGLNHSVILLKNGRVLIMGKNDKGQLGLGKEITQVNFPTEIPNIGKIKQIAAGDYHTLLLTENNQVLAMGSNYLGRLGLDSSVSKVFFPEKLPIHDVESIAAQDASTILVTGNNVARILTSNSDVGTVSLDGVVKVIPSWLELGETKAIQDISCAGNHALILSKEGDLYGVGSNVGGALGLGTNETFQKKGTQLLEGTKVKWIKATGEGSLIITEDDKLMVTGSNRYGQFGTQDENNYHFKNIIDDIAQVSANEYHTLVLKNDGELIGMGNNEEGQLGVLNETGMNLTGLFYDLLKQSKPESFKINTPTSVAGFFKLKNRIQSNDGPASSQRMLNLW